MNNAPAAEPLLGIGEVRHTRLRPARNAFVYPTYFLMLPMRRLAAAPVAALRRNRFGLISFHDADHGDGRTDSLAWLDELLRQEGVRDAGGEVWLQCFPRVLGLAFKPVSFWYCHRVGGALAAIVVEVNNTFGERHCYLLTDASAPGSAAGRLAFGRELQADKVFHVSPFCRTEGRYRFRFMRNDLPGLATRTGPGAYARSIARIDHDDADGPLLQTSIGGELRRLTPERIRAAFFGVPLMTLGVITRIHWQALRLWWKRVPFIQKPAAPAQFVSR